MPYSKEHQGKEMREILVAKETQSLEDVSIRQKEN